MKINQNKISFIPCKDDYEGKVVATFIETTQKLTDQAVLYIHGFNDYFFQDFLAEKYNQNGFDFYALELRKYGHSKLNHQHFFYVRNIKEYYEEITHSINLLIGKGYKKISLMGHSMGGLVATMYAHEGELKNNIHSLMLNGPFFNFPVPPLLKNIISKIASIMSKVFPYSYDKLVKDVLGGLYMQSLHSAFKGEWDYIVSIKQGDVKIYYAWVLAILEAHKIVQNGLNINVPILVMHSNKSYFPKKWTDEIKERDIILDVEDMKKFGSGLGNKVELMEIKNGVHDLFLSKLEVREEAMTKSIDWLKKVSND
jgi:alpha-beta hydrolase superfamily lysophospholipase